MSRAIRLRHLFRSEPAIQTASTEAGDTDSCSSSSSSGASSSSSGAEGFVIVPDGAPGNASHSLVEPRQEEALNQQLNTGNDQESAKVDSDGGFASFKVTIIEDLEEPSEESLPSSAHKQEITSSTHEEKYQQSKTRVTGHRVRMNTFPMLNEDSFHPSSCHQTHSRNPVPLWTKLDEHVLSPIECLLRKNIEFFENDAGTVGLRCRNCAHRCCPSSNSIEFPKNYDQIIISAQVLLAHLVYCRDTSDPLREELCRLSKKRVEFDYFYWRKSAYDKGVLPGLRWSFSEDPFGRSYLPKNFYNYKIPPKRSTRSRKAQMPENYYNFQVELPQQIDSYQQNV